MAPKTHSHCNYPGCTEPCVVKQPRCADHHKLYMDEYAREYRHKKKAPGPREEQLIMIEPNGDVVEYHCVAVRRIPAREFRNRAERLVTFMDFLRSRGVRLVQLVTPAAAAGAVDAARAESEAGAL